MGWCANELVVVQAPIAYVRGGQGREGLGRTPEGTPPVMGTEQVKGPLEEETPELRGKRSKSQLCKKQVDRQHQRPGQCVEEPQV